MKRFLLILILFSSNLKAQKNNSLILMNKVDTIGMVSSKLGVVFTTQVDKEVKKDIALRFNKKGRFVDRKFINLSKMHFMNEYYSYDSQTKGLFKTVFDENTQEHNTQELENRLKRAGNTYLVSESIALSGAAVSLAITESDPALAVQVALTSQTAAYLVRIIGHITLKS